MPIIAPTLMSTSRNLEKTIPTPLICPATYVNDTKIKQMWVQGINMYMGKNAVIVDSVYAKEMKKVYNAHLFLGACSEPKMRWQLIVQTTDNDEIVKSWFFNFSTDRNK